MRWTISFLALLLIISLAPPRIAAQGQIEILSSSVENRFPNGIAFKLEAQSPNVLEKVSFLYKVGEEQSFKTVSPPFSPGRRVVAEYILGSKTEGTYLHPRAELSYQWALEDAAGDKHETPLATAIYQDIRFDWQQATSEGVTLSWYRGSEIFMRRLLERAVTDLRRISRLLGLTEDLTVEVLVYSSLYDLRDALPWKSRTPDPKLPTLGLQVSPKMILLLGSQPDVARTLAHELSHVAVRQGIGYIPSWLDEGLALLVEGELAPEHAVELEQAVRLNTLLPLRAMTEVPDPREPRRVWLFYGQAYSVARFLLESHGQDKLRTLMALLKTGRPFDEALQEVHGWNTDGLELDWRDSMGLSPRREKGENLEVSPEMSKELTLAPSRPFLAFALLAAFFASCLFLFPFTTLWLVAAAIIISRRRHAL